MVFFGRRRLGGPVTIVTETIYEDGDFLDDEVVVEEEVVVVDPLSEIVEEVIEVIME